MTGYFTGVPARFMLSQGSDLTGYTNESGGTLPETFDLLTHPPGIDPPTPAIGLLTLVLVLPLERTRLAPVAMVVGLAASGAWLARQAAALQRGPRRHPRQRIAPTARR